METDNAGQVKDRVDITYPDTYQVLMLNDDFTTMDFVVMVLTQVFRHSSAQAVQIMLQIHNEGEAVVGQYTLDIAQTKVAKVQRMAKEDGFPLRLKIEKA
ncbi:MAG: ATP-dependent Clp protease adaptor ClpS [Bacteroidaceae bacterium]|nr:ATP-dependent Clp protease adaptor ClpS [Bacteroidaceae bacterium]